MTANCRNELVADCATWSPLKHFWCVEVAKHATPGMQLAATVTGRLAEETAKLGAASALARARGLYEEVAATYRVLAPAHVVLAHTVREAPATESGSPEFEKVFLWHPKPMAALASRRSRTNSCTTNSYCELRTIMSCHITEVLHPLLSRRKCRLGV